MVPILWRAQRGASIAVWLIAIVPVLGVGAFAIDLNNIFIRMAELQAAADAGALEGTRELYVRQSDGTLAINTDVGPNDADDPARQAAEENDNRRLDVDVISVERGHWQFQPIDGGTTPEVNDIQRGGVFVPSSNAMTDTASLVTSTGAFRHLFDDNLDSELSETDTCDLGDPDYPDQYVDARDVNSDPCNINAVRVRVQGDESIPVLLGRLLGVGGDYDPTATAVGYVGFASYVDPGELDAPIALCEHKLQLPGDDEYLCNVGRFSPSSDVQNTGETAQWVNFSECGDDAVDTGDLTSPQGGGLVDIMQCPVNDSGINSEGIEFGTSLEVNNGEIDTATTTLYDNWLACGALDQDGDGCPDTPWRLRLPVIDCLDDSDPPEPLPRGACKTLVGGVAIQLLWVNDSVTAGGLPCTVPADTSANPAAVSKEPIPQRMTGVSARDASGALSTINWDVDYPAGGTPEDIDGDGVDDPFEPAVNRYGDPISTCVECPCAATDDPVDIDGNPVAAIPAYADYAEGDYCRHKQIWDSFVSTFNIYSDANTIAWWQDPPATNSVAANTYYFAPYCEEIEFGGTGGNNRGVLADTPVLVF
jgi:hypothetical protein